MNLWLCLFSVCLAQTVYGATVPPAAPVTEAPVIEADVAAEVPAASVINNAVNEGDLGYEIFENDETTDDDDGLWDGTMELDPGQHEVIGIAQGVVSAARANDPTCVTKEPVESDKEGGIIGFPHYLDTDVNTACHHADGDTGEWGDCWCPETQKLCKIERTNMLDSGPKSYYCFSQDAISGVDDSWFYGSGLILDSLENPIVAIHNKDGVGRADEGERVEGGAAAATDADAGATDAEAAAAK